MPADSLFDAVGAFDSKWSPPYAIISLWFADLRNGLVNTLRRITEMEGNAAFPEWFWPFVFLAIFVFVWACLCYFISVLGGWRSLARVYPASQFLPGERFRFRSAWMGAGINYRISLTLEANTQGLHISVFLPLRIGHPSLFIPWEEISAEPEMFFWLRKANLQFAKCPEIPFSISIKLAEKLSQASGFLFKVEEP